MSEATVNPPNRADAPASRTRKRSLQTGFSLLARGEPKIWFTGGMLVVCLAMIVGLLTLILMWGLPSFWVRPMELMALNDGSLEIGQPQSSKPANAELTEDGVPLADDALRRYYRTGNHEVTQRYYRWLEPTELDASGIGRPAWALLLERIESGRIYGLPLELIERIDLLPEERRRMALIDDLRGVLSEAAGDGAEPLPAVDAALSSAEQQERDAALRQRLEAMEGLEAVQIQCQIAGAEGWRPVADVGQQESWQALRATWNTYAAVCQSLRQRLVEVHGLRDRAKRLKHAISRLDAQISELRVAVRRAEIETKTQADVQVDQSHYLLEHLQDLEGQQAKIGPLRQLLEELLADDATLRQAAVQRLNDYGESKLPEKIKQASEELDRWLEPALLQPEPIVQAVRNYLSGYRQIVKQKKPLQLELADIEQQLALVEIRMALPSNPQAVDGLEPSDLEGLLAGQVTDNLSEQLASSEIVLDDDALDWEAVGEHLSLLPVLGREGARQMLAVTRSGYLSPDASDQRWNLWVLSEKTVGGSEIVRAVEVNQLGLGGKLSVYFDRWQEFLLDEPREANAEGGVFPAIWGTVVMTLLMTIAVVPFGVMAALYLREYTKSGTLVSLIRISINNLAGVPSIVYGVFGFSFFCYTIGAFIDGGPKNADIVPWPSATWFTVLGAIIVAGVIAFFCSFLSSGPVHSQTPFKKWTSRIAMILWLTSVAMTAILILKSPFFEGYYREYLPVPTFGKGGLLWAALTLALLTLPVVIVATEEALAAVPNSLREGSLACGASKWQTIRRIVLPHARPGILTGAILAMARGAGEVAPLMLVGALPLAPDLPLDGEFPFFHGSRSFMHLGYQIYTLGFQSRNSEASKPMVFTCTLLLILIVAALNISAIYLRARLKRKFQGTQF